MDRERRTIRLSEYDYSNEGAYSITVCVHGRLCLFGEIANEKTILSRYGSIVQRCWDQLTDHYTGIELDTFVIMPNHVHAIIIITDDIVVKRDGVPIIPVGAGLKPADMPVMPFVGAGFKPAPTGTKRHGLPEIIRAFKTFSAREINRVRNAPGRPIWQRNYYEHIIRKGDEYRRIKRYLLENPANWSQDDENPNRISCK